MAYDEELDQRVRAILGAMLGLEVKKTFGGVGYLLHGNTACGVHGERLIVRLPAADYEGALSQPHVFVFDLTGRPMRGWITVEQPFAD